jgi:uncharacterized SAM-binding protein YcdF (DUF218 family)
MFVLLKVLLFFLRPIVWIVALFIIALFQSNAFRKQRLLKVAVLLLVIFTNPFIIRQVLNNYEAKPFTPRANTHFSAGIVLGGFISYNKKDDRGYFNAASDRFIQTALLYKQGNIDRIIVAAGNGYITNHDFKEANFIKERLVTLGIPAERILTDSTSRNTVENATNTNAIIQAERLQGPFFLITSAMHMPRAKLAFEKQHITVIPYPCDFDSRNVGNNFIEDFLLPSALALNKWENLIKEIAGITVYKITGKG